MVAKETPFEIRPVKNTDVPQVLKLIKTILESEFGKEASVYPQIDLYDLESSYGGDRDQFFVAEKSGQIIGTVAIKEEDAKVALLRRVFVNPRYRGKGYGLRLVEEAIAFCKKKRYKTISFRGTSRMAMALSLCRKKGFEEVDRVAMEDFQIIRYTLRLP